MTMPRQDMPPSGGFPETIRYQRFLPNRGPSGAFIFTTIFALMGFGFYKVKQANDEKRQIRNEKYWARIHLVPLLQAETDRDLVRRFDAMTEREAEIMKDHPEWKPFDLKAPIKGLGKKGELDEKAAEPVYHTERYVAPNLVFLPMDNETRIPAQSWRGTKWFFKNPPYQDRQDWQTKGTTPQFEEI